MRGQPIWAAANRFRQVADERWKDARCLRDGKRYDGAIYLCGYVLECFLKFVLCQLRGRDRMELAEAKLWNHDLIDLLGACRLAEALKENTDLQVAFTRISSHWSPEMRYSGRTSDERTSASFLQDTKDLRNWLQAQLTLTR